MSVKERRDPGFVGPALGSEAQSGAPKAGWALSLRRAGCGAWAEPRGCYQHCSSRIP